MERVILHSDLNNFYASVECLYNPALRGKPVAVAGDPEARHGIVLAKNYAAKACGVATGNPLWMAKQKCPDIVFVPPHYDLYMKYSKIAREIYSEYTDRVESYGLDECWLDVTGSTHLFGSGKAIADELRERIKQELGVTVSVGVSYNKIFAKLGSDMKKPDATTVITSSRFREIVWPLPVSDLLYVGRATHNKLRRYGITTIGRLAQANQDFLRHLLGKNGEMLWLFANGLDTSPVSNIGAKSLIKSIGNSTTAPRDLVTDEDIRITLRILSESVSARMREYDFVCSTVQIGVRDNELHSYERQGKLLYPNRTASALSEKAFELYKQNHSSGKPVRSLSVRACKLSVLENEQLSLLPEISSIQKQEVIDSVIDNIRSRFGHFSVQRGIMLCDKRLSSLNPKEDHIIHPESFFKS
ncbi:DNA polymerase IV [Ructibacterium gallinarum]|uniref:DNA polymerase IV n=1 Tax=Ructibacterium gallinarum TaxID=2779355 RepID=A0A9D5M4P5_9FIRM|nr:DNA polymerase IV [Ructibacterium gallinarum]MBE5040550.1 DNA polymerase IV [Ructibacterium gallinarum]